MKLFKVRLILVLSAAVLSANADVTLGSFNFNSTLFGDTLVESDGGSYSGRNWLNTTINNPGSPAVLTGPNFKTGVANIGLDNNPPSYTIGYNTPIMNGSGMDFGVVVARFSSNAFTISVSTDGGITFSADTFVDAATAETTGVTQSYYYAGGGPYDAVLFVHPLDLQDFGIGANAGINAVRITGMDELDLLRVAGFAPVPEPSTFCLLGLAGVGLLGFVRRQYRKL